MSKYQEKITKAAEKVEKCKGTIARHEKQLEKKQQVLIKMGYDISDLEAIKWNTEKGGGSECYWEVCDVESKLRDIEGAKKNLAEAERILKKWQDAQAAEDAKSNFIEDNTPQVIKDFLEQWKTQSYRWHVKRYEDYLVFKQELKEKAAAFKEANGIPDYKMPTKAQKELLEENNMDSKSLARRLAKYAGQAVLHMETMRDSERLVWLEKTLEEEKNRKLLDLVRRVTEVAGQIKGADTLEIGHDGNLNGYVYGTKEIVKVETIMAGGWNIQCFHYRVLVTKVK